MALCSGIQLAVELHQPDDAISVHAWLSIGISPYKHRLYMQYSGPCIHQIAFLHQMLCMIFGSHQWVVVSTWRGKCHLDKHRQLGDAIHPLHKVPRQAVIHVVVEDGDSARGTQLVMWLA